MPKVVLWPLYMHQGMCEPAPRHMHTHKDEEREEERKKEDLKLGVVAVT